jgi:hypothetical protein
MTQQAKGDSSGPERSGTVGQSPQVNCEYLEGKEVLPDGRYLLYDSGCGTCREIAFEIGELGKDWFSVRSLNETIVKDTLTRKDENWSFEPTLLEVTSNSEQIAIYTGLSMKAHMVAVLKPILAVKIWNAVRKLHRQEATDTYEFKFTPKVDEPDTLVLASVKVLDRKSAIKLGVASIAAAFLSTIPGLSGLALAESQPSKVARARRLRGKGAYKIYRSLIKTSEIRPVHQHLVNRGYRLIRSSVTGYSMAGNGKATVAVAARFKKGSKIAGLSLLQVAGNGKVRRSAAYNNAINGGKGAEVWSRRQGRVVKTHSWRDWRREYRRLMGKNPPSINTIEQKKTTDGFAFQSYGTCDLCITLAGLAFTDLCEAAIGPPAALAALACGVGYPVCISIALIVAAAATTIGCAILGDVTNAGEVLCGPENLGIC